VNRKFDMLTKFYIVLVCLLQHLSTLMTKRPSGTFDDSFTQKWQKPLILTDISSEVLKAQFFQFFISALL